MRRKIRIILFAIMSVILVYDACPYTTLLGIYDEGDEALGFSFSKQSFTSGHDGDIYAKRVHIGEGTSLVFFSYFDTLKNIGKENLNEFRCNNLAASDYVSQAEIHERQGYCVLSQGTPIRIFVESASEEVALSWTPDLGTEDGEAAAPKKESEAGVPEGDAKIVAAAVVESEEEPHDKEFDFRKKEEYDQPGDKFFRLAKEYFQEIMTSPFVLLFVALLTLSCLLFIFIEKKKNEK